MNDEEKGNSLEPEDTSSTDSGSELGTKLPEAGPEDTNAVAPIATETPQTVETIEQSADADGSPSLSVDDEPRIDEAASSVAVNSVSIKKTQSFFEEQPLPVVAMAPQAKATGKFVATTLPIAGGWGSVAIAHLTTNSRGEIITANADAGSITIYFLD